MVVGFSKPNSSVALDLLVNFITVMMKAILDFMPGTVELKSFKDHEKLVYWNLIGGVYVTCLGMSLNGVKIGFISRIIFLLTR